MTPLETVRKYHPDTISAKVHEWFIPETGWHKWGGDRKLTTPLLRELAVKGATTVCLRVEVEWEPGINDPSSRINSCTSVSTTRSLEISNFDLKIGKDAKAKEGARE